jgi:ATP-dependent exoDNAse (exonuclease V) beta subunit
MKITDATQRQQALNPAQSFIVQAPAGSGKTELLTQRFLNLLTTVDKNPEEVLAITFTKKAANEMRQRIFAALQLATQAQPTEAHKQTTWEIAKRVLQRDTQENWQLLNNPNRLRVQTIDSFCSYLSKQLPILSQLGSGFAMVENAEADYQQGAMQLLLNLEEDLPWSNSIACLLLHLDNNLSLVNELLVTMLANRDQWLSHVVTAKNNADLREHLEKALQRLIENTLQELLATFPQEEQQEILELTQYALCHDWGYFPKGKINEQEKWQILATFLLTKDFDWRKRLTVNEGFPPKGETKAETEFFRSMKQRAIDLLTRLADNEDLRRLLQDCLQLPPATYDEQQWKILTALLELLPILAAQLNVIFQQKGDVDFIEVTQRALQALNQEESPTDLALYLDYQIKHILVDEFQDTSATQYRLLELLTQAWQHNDGRSLFLVGDPMQSIYRFRAAEVGLFLQVKQFGIGQLRLTPITLSTNFRSSTRMVDWFNETFKTAFPEKNNLTLGAISYSMAEAVHETTNTDVHYHQITSEESNKEAATIVDILQRYPENKTAILVRNRQHLIEIIPALKAAQINFQAVEIEKLGHLPFIQDLTSLTLALSYFSHRLAWLAILRAPWCGLRLHDLHTIANPLTQATIWQRINDSAVFSQLTEDGQQRLHHFRQTLTIILQQRGRLNLTQWVKSAWLAIGGPATLRPHDNLADAQTFFELLAQCEHGGQLDKISNLEKQLEKLYAKSSSSDANVHIMTIHKAKGLEFDVVILPGLERFVSTDKAKLLLWQERPIDNHNIDLLLAPIKAKKDSSDPIYNYIKQFEQRKTLYEYARLFYVATTRAKQHLHLLANFKSLEKLPRMGSFLSLIWERHKTKFVESSHLQTSTNNTLEQGVRRFATAYQLPVRIEKMLPILQLETTINQNMPVWQSNENRKIGIVLHRLLQELSKTPKENWYKIIEQQTLHKILLQQQAINEIEQALQGLKLALTRISQSTTAQWILSTKHQSPSSEQELVDNGQHYFIDRSFISHNTRWIIDYKISQPKTEQTLSDFLRQEQTHYRPQLEQYARILHHSENLPIKLMLYFPLLDEQITWGYDDKNTEDLACQ